MKVELTLVLPDKTIAEALHAAAVEAARELAASPAPQSPWLDVAGVAAYSSMSPQAVRDAERHGHLRGHRSTNGRLRFAIEDVETFLRGKAA